MTENGGFAGTAAAFTVDGDREVSFWIARHAWGRGVATEALRLLVSREPERPLFARAAAHNAGSIAVLEKGGFTEVSRNVAFAPGRRAARSRRSSSRSSRRSTGAVSAPRRPETTKGPRIRGPFCRFVREGGVEPPRPFGHWHLKPARLPIPPLARAAASEDPAKLNFPRISRVLRRHPNLGQMRGARRSRDYPACAISMYNRPACLRSRVGLLDSFEKGLERAVNSAFAKTFRSGIQPVEIASALRSELDKKAAVVSRDRILAPNTFTVRLSPADDEQDAGARRRRSATSSTRSCRSTRRRRATRSPGPVSIALERDDAALHRHAARRVLDGAGHGRRGAVSSTSTASGIRS